MRYSQHGFGVSYRFNGSDYKRMQPIVKTIMEEYGGDVNIYGISTTGEIYKLDCEEATCDMSVTELLDYYCHPPGRFNTSSGADFVLYFDLDSYQSHVAEAEQLTDSGFTINSMCTKLTNIDQLMRNCGISPTVMNFSHYTSDTS
jgi:hypothetical protein